ncbi:uncharacterized protein Z519_09619 [Cladophialophora bantiana CBS 173.52]|uniref:Zn(2)-C6 fungal-type domain-containing protein n=1 Tax=Cladophialophora bantiana (strain ATCC 10958 / CBS 173.52 / CDC B-1940 / NIH 8579) TaxID=1442370 RepID=A0A0D2H858_CLAB1|nr:uncharacterized protein Z519_09619 [Cladophialophora bantiana CBS 173.52]KIW89463.1 hypothetical protein Z519_09619 [Cladophialophora bantiana CBS 173.52]
MDTGRLKRPARPPPRLRTKTGCYTCRARRKKCDEAHPICGACRRLEIQCIYRELTSPTTASRTPPIPSPRARSSTVAENPVDVSSTVPTLHRSLSQKHSGLRTERDWNVFNYCSTRYIRLLTSPEATAEFRDVSFVFAIGFDAPWVMHSALAPAALHASFASLIPKEDAMLYTQSALQGFQQALQPTTCRSFPRDAFLAASLFLGVFEGGCRPSLCQLSDTDINQDFYSSSCSASLTHYRAIAKIVEGQVAEIPRLDIGQLSILHLTLLDSVLYHFSTRLIFEKDIGATCRSFPRQTVIKYIEALECAKGDGRTGPLILPVLGRTPPALFLQIYQITWLSRQVPFAHCELYGLALQCSTEVEGLAEDYPMIASDNIPSLQSTVAVSISNSEIAAKLYYIATQIFIAKVLNLEGLSSQSPQIQAQLSKGVVLLEMYDASLPCGQFICWPLLVLGCAACPTTKSEVRQSHLSNTYELRRSTMRCLIQAKLVQIWNVSYSGYVKRTAGALKKIWQLPSILAKIPVNGYAADEEIEYDGLMALIQKDGLGAASLLAEDSSLLAPSHFSRWSYVNYYPSGLSSQTSVNDASYFDAFFVAHTTREYLN